MNKVEKQTLKELEAEATKLHNKQVDLIDKYVTLLAANKEETKEANDIKAEYNKVSFDIKAINRRIQLLKHQTKESEVYRVGKNINAGHSRSDPVYK